MRESAFYHIKEPNQFKLHFLAWIKTQETTILFDSHEYYVHSQSKVAYHDYNFLAATGKIQHIKANYPYALSSLEGKMPNYDWWFGYISYDVKNEIENLSSDNDDELNFPELFFFQPRFVFILVEDKLEIRFLKDIDSKANIDEIFDAITNIQPLLTEPVKFKKIETRFTKEEYLFTIKQLMNHIQNGDIYEVNFCQEFYTRDVILNPYNLFKELNQVSPTPFSCFLKNNHNYLISASPERFLKKTGKRIISQPIKGTIRRGKTVNEDQQLYNKLKNSKKDIAENTMIVDLVRNDLSKIAKTASVCVEELCGIYAYPQVHQMISTISAELKENSGIVDILRATFPMGSMTGAPKIRAMELIEKYERTKRGLYSGAVGYIDPQGNFDFNVVIRSILYNQSNQYLSFSVGGAITSLSDPELEYEECLLKAKAIQKVLQNET